MVDNKTIYTPTLSGALLSPVFIISFILTEIIYRSVFVDFLTQQYPNYEVFWLLGPNVFFIPLAVIRQYLWVKHGWTNIYSIEISDGKVSGITDVKNIKGLIQGYKSLADQVSQSNFTLHDYMMTHSDRIQIAVDDIDWDKSFKPSLIRRSFKFKIGLYHYIYSKDGRSILLHWYLGQNTIKQLKNDIEKLK